jgi:hypothetical protein
MVMKKEVYEVYSVNGKVAIQPIVVDKIETKIQGGFASIAQKKEVVQAVVVYPYSSASLDVMPDDLVMLRGDVAFRTWNKDVLTLGDVQFVLCPVEEIIAVMVKQP